MKDQTLQIRTSPHLKRPLATNTIMLHVVLSLIPVMAFAVYAFGITALFLISTTTIACVGTEYVLNGKVKGKQNIKDWSAVLTGVLLALTLPPGFPLWMAFVGGMIAIALGKFVFGGLGQNLFNPALVGRAMLQAAFPVAITTWTETLVNGRFSHIIPSSLTIPFLEPIKADAVSGATPLSAFKFDKISTDVQDLAFGFTSGSLGETCAFLIVLGGVYLGFRKMLNWRIPVGILGTVATLTGILFYLDPVKYPSPLMMLFSGGLMLGAVYMATDMVSSPLSTIGIWIYSFVIGLLVVLIRIWGGLPEGVMYAILFGNALAPILDKSIPHRIYGMSSKNQNKNRA